jgi:hypothetical protein
VRLLELRHDWPSLRVALAAGEGCPAGIPRRRHRFWAVGRTGSVIHAQPLDPAFHSLLSRMGGGLSWQAAVEATAGEFPRQAGRVRDWFALGAGADLWAVVGRI